MPFIFVLSHKTIYHCTTDSLGPFISSRVLCWSSFDPSVLMHKGQLQSNQSDRSHID